MATATQNRNEDQALLDSSKSSFTKNHRNFYGTRNNAPISFSEYSSTSVKPTEKKPSAHTSLKYQIIVSDTMGFIQRLEPNTNKWIQADYFLYTGILAEKLDPTLGGFDLQCLTLSLKSAVRAQAFIARTYSSFSAIRTILLIEHVFTDEELNCGAYPKFLNVVEKAQELGFTVQYVNYQSPPKYDYMSHNIQVWPELDKLSDHTCTVYFEGESVKEIFLSPVTPTVAPVGPHKASTGVEAPKVAIAAVSTVAPKALRKVRQTRAQKLNTTQETISPSEVISLDDAFEE